MIQRFINVFNTWPSTLVSILHSVYSYTLSVSFFASNCGQLKPRWLNQEDHCNLARPSRDCKLL